MKNISEHISYREAVESQTANRLHIDNTPNEFQLKNMEIVAKACFEPLREWYGKPININSFFRCEALNASVHGSRTSQHMQGKAIDMDAGSEQENKKIFDWCKYNLKFDQLLYEKGSDIGPEWVHISFDLGNNRNQVIRIK